MPFGYLSYRPEGMLPPLHRRSATMDEKEVIDERTESKRLSRID
jgi:hypothetical protein